MDAAVRSLVAALHGSPWRYSLAVTGGGAGAGAWLLSVAGVGCTASLRSDRPKRGDHRFHLSVETDTRTLTHSLTLAKEARDREGEEEVVDRVLLNALAEAFGLPDRLPVPLLPGEEVLRDEAPDDDAVAELLAGRVPVLCV